MPDLHLHSTHSDGILTPDALVSLAMEEGVSPIAIADHDAVSGVDEAMESGRRRGVQVIPAVELSVIYSGITDIHLLGYGIDHHDPQFQERLFLFQRRRDSRSEAIVHRINARLKRQGLSPITYDEVISLADGAVGRPHIARVMMDRGIVSSMEEAFDDYLIPCNVPKEYFPLEEAVHEIHRIGGIAVLAHPTSMTDDPARMIQLIDRFIHIGLDGLEAFHSMVPHNECSLLIDHARRHGLIVTGGSDFHGIEEGERVGMIRGEVTIPQWVGAELERRVRIPVRDRV